MFKAGQKISSYTLVKKLGRGGFGEVWLADSYGRYVTTQVAVKLPLDEQVDHDLIEQEAGLWARASGHTNVLPIIEANEYDGQIVIISEYAPDGSLEQLLKNNSGKLPVKQAVEMTIGILNGLEFLHSRNIIHRDLKPANVLLQGETPRLADFGISRALQTTVASQTQNISGTFAYMSPEALDGKRSIQTDIWAVGANLYRFLTGKLPFPQKEPSALFPAIIMRDYEELPADIPQSLKTVIAKSLAKLPENRYQTAVEMREDLQKIQRGENISASVQTNFDKPIPDSAIPPTEKVTIDSARNFQPETKTVVRPVLTFGENEKLKSSNFWMFATIGLFLIISTIWGVYFFNSDKSNDLNQIKSNEIAEKSSSNTSDLQKAIEPSNSNIDISTPESTPTPIPTPNKSQLNQQANKYIAGIGKVPGTFEDDKKSRKIIYGDLDNDGDDDAVVYFELFPHGGNGEDIYLAAFRNNNGQFVSVTDVNLSGGGPGKQKFYISQSGKITLEYYDYNLEKRKKVYVLINDKLKSSQ
ncbi:MAG: serine/threonine-protein kinase [Aridibacter sp.]